MANKANLLLSETFDGALGDPWPLVWPTGNPGGAKPRLDGKGRGLGSLNMVAGTGKSWRGYSSKSPGRDSFKVDLWAKWKNAGFAGERGVGLIVLFEDYSNCLIARLTSKLTLNPTLELIRVSGGTPSVLASYTGPGVNASKMNAGMKWRVRVGEEDRNTGLTTVKVYTDPLGDSGDGTLRITYTGDLTQFRGARRVGVELTWIVYNDDVRVDNLEVYDFADEWTPPKPSGAGGTGWQAEIDGVLYDVLDDDDAAHPRGGAAGLLEGTNPPIFLESVRQGYGPTGNEAVLTTGGGFTGGIVRPNSRVVVYHDGNAVFRGRVTKGRQTGTAESESQSWTCRDAWWAARNVILEEEDGSGVRYYNVSEKQDERYNPDRQGMTIGAILKDLFDLYTVSEYGLRFYGAAPPDGTAAYVLSELNLLDAVVPNVAVSNNFAAAVETLLGWMPKFQVWIDPDDQVWHVRDVTTLAGDVVSFGQEWARVEVEPDPSRSFTAVLWRGAKKEEKADETISFSTDEKTLEPTTSEGQKGTFDSSKKGRSSYLLKVLNAGTAPFPLPAGWPKSTLVYVDVSANEGLDTDELRGSIVSVSGDAYVRFCVGNSSTRIYLATILWGGGTPPAVPTTAVASLVDPEAAPWLSTMLSEQAFFLPPVELCPGFGGIAGAYKGGMRQGGFCGEASVEYTKDGKTYRQNYAAKVHFASAMASGAGACRPAVVLAEKPKPPLALINYFPPKGGSPPLSSCEAGNRNDASTFPQVKVSFKMKRFEEKAPSIRVPASGFSGEAFSKWGVEQVYVYDDAEFTEDSQKAGLTKAAQALLDVYSQRTFLFSIDLGTPWRAQFPQVPTVPNAVARWAGLFSSISLSSPVRSMPDFETPSTFPVFEVTWNLRARTTTLRAGTAAGWLSYDARVLTRDLREASVAKKIADALATLEDFRSRLIEKNLAAQQQPLGGVPGCDVEVIDKVNRRVVDVQKKFDNDQPILSQVAATSRLLEDLLLGEEKVVPGSPVVPPGVGTGYVVPGRGEVLGPPVADPRIPGGGARDDVPNGATSRYGGVPGADDPTFGDLPNHGFRRGAVAFRLEKNAAGQIVGVQAAPLGTGGTIPVGGWTRIEKPRDVLDVLGVPPERIAGKESIVGRLVRTDDSTLEALNRKKTDEGLPVAPGTPTTEYPDRTPPDLSSYLRTPGAQGYFRPLAETWEDPGGLVFYGPTNGRIEQAKLWRVLVPENVLVEVSKTPGAGTNGGDYSPVVYPGGVYFYLEDATVLHKQAHPSDYEPDARLPGQPPILAGERNPQHPFGFGAIEPPFAPAGLSGIGATFAIPGGIVGRPFVEVIVREDPATILAPGMTYDFQVEVAYQASPWTAPAVAATGTVTTDGTGNAQGPFKGPGGAVPPGLRAPSDIPGGMAVSVVALGTGTGFGTGAMPRLVGIGVELAVVKGGFLLRISEEVSVADVVRPLRGTAIEDLSFGDSFVLEARKGLAEGLDLRLEIAVELNPPVEAFEDLTIEDSVATVLL